MLLRDSINTEVTGTGYMIEYTIIQDTGEEEPGELPEYGICCALFKENETVSSEEIKCITPDYKKVQDMIQKLVRNQVFPVHLRDVIEDLLIIEYGEEGILAFNLI